jgi:hypothetical protein
MTDLVRRGWRRAATRLPPRRVSAHGHTGQTLEEILPGRHSSLPDLGRGRRLSRGSATGGSRDLHHPSRSSVAAKGRTRAPTAAAAWSAARTMRRRRSGAGQLRRLRRAAHRCRAPGFGSIDGPGGQPGCTGALTAHIDRQRSPSSRFPAPPGYSRPRHGPAARHASGPCDARSRRRPEPSPRRGERHDHLAFAVAAPLRTARRRRPRKWSASWVHLALLEGDFRRRGRSPDDGAAQRGGIRHAGQTPDAQSLLSLEEIRRDTRTPCARWPAPRATAAAVLTMAIGLAGPRPLQPWLRRRPRQPLPWPDADRLVRNRRRRGSNPGRIPGRATPPTSVAEPAVDHRDLGAWRSRS